MEKPGGSAPLPVLQGSPPVGPRAAWAPGLPGRTLPTPCSARDGGTGTGEGDRRGSGAARASQRRLLVSGAERRKLRKR